MQNLPTGGCFCGAVRYTLRAPPMFTNCCHCLDCQRQTGAAFAINAIVEASAVEIIAGEPVRVTLPTDSGQPHDVYRCSICQTALWSDYGRRGWLSFLRVATLDNPHAIAPDAHIFTRSKVPWVELGAVAPPGGTARSATLAPGSATGKPPLVCDVYYDMASEWPAASHARRAAASTD